MRQEARRARVSRTVVKERQVGAASRREAAAHSGAHAINREKDFGSLLTRAEKAMRVAAYLDQLKNRARVRARRDGRLNRSHNHRQPAPATDQVASMAPSMDMILEECNGSSSSSSDAEAEAADAEHQQRKRRKTALTPRQECGVDLAVRLHQDSLQQLRNSRRPSHALHRCNTSSQVAREELAFQTWCHVNGLKTPTDMARQAIEDAQEHGCHDELMTEGGMALKKFIPADHIRDDPDAAPARDLLDQVQDSILPDQNNGALLTDGSAKLEGRRRGEGRLHAANDRKGSTQHQKKTLAIEHCVVVWVCGCIDTRR